MLVRHDVYKVGIDGRVEPITGQRVTGNYYTLLGVPAVLGRTLQPADQPDKGGGPVAVISYGLWQRRFGGNPDVIGRSITVDRQPYTIVGVTPPDVRGHPGRLDDGRDDAARPVGVRGRAAAGPRRR